MISRRNCGRPWSLWVSLFCGMLVFALPSFGQGGRQPTRVPLIMQPNASDEPSSMKLRVEGQDVVAQIRNTPLQDVLAELAAWSGVVFEIDSQENPKITITFFSVPRVPLQEAIRRLTGNNNSISFYDHDEAGQTRISFVRVLTRTPRPNPPTLHYIGSGAISKRSDDIVDSPEQALAVLAGSSNLAARQKAIEVLAAAKSVPAIQALRMVLTDPAVEIKVSAIDSLASLGVHDALPQILPALKDAHPGVRQSAVVAVGLLGDATNVKDLRPLLKDPDGSVVAAANVAIQKLSTRRP
jgi:hypothetical protein